VTALAPDLVAAWQAALAAEHQAAFGYGLLGPRLSGAAQQYAVTCSDAHEALRDATEQAMAAQHLRPVPPQVDYPALYPVPDAAAARALAARLEDECAVAWRALFARVAALPGATAAARRDDAQQRLSAAAVRAMTWRRFTDPTRATRAFPGI
jgi:hypothetical protein